MPQPQETGFIACKNKKLKKRKIRIENKRKPEKKGLTKSLSLAATFDKLLPLVALTMNLLLKWFSY